jgi:hypothetical protein
VFVRHSLIRFTYRMVLQKNDECCHQRLSLRIGGMFSLRRRTHLYPQPPYWTINISWPSNSITCWQQFRHYLCNSWERHRSLALPRPQVLIDSPIVTRWYHSRIPRANCSQCRGFPLKAC